MSDAADACGHADRGERRVRGDDLRVDPEVISAGRITSEFRQVGNRYERAVAPEPDRRELRARDRALGLVPFAVMLPQELVQRLRQAQAGGVGLNELTAELLRKGLAG